MTLNAGCILITGGASGIGAAVAERFRQIGENVVIADRRLDASQTAAPENNAHAYLLDIGEQDEVAAVVSEIERDISPIKTLVNCAGPLQKTDRPEDLTMTAWDRITNVHLRGTYMVTVAVGTRMARRRAGSIVTVASVMGMRSGPLHAYGPAKAALINLSEGLAAEWGPQNVRVNTVSPGFVQTPALAKGLRSEVLLKERLERSSALGRLVTADEIANAILFLASDQASAITGCNLPVDAGYLVTGSWNAYGGLRGAAG